MVYSCGLLRCSTGPSMDKATRGEGLILIKTLQPNPPFWTHDRNKAYRNVRKEHSETKKQEKQSSSDDMSQVITKQTWCLTSGVTYLRITWWARRGLSVQKAASLAKIADAAPKPKRGVDSPGCIAHRATEHLSHASDRRRVQPSPNIPHDDAGRPLRWNAKSNTSGISVRYGRWCTWTRRLRFEF